MEDTYEDVVFTKTEATMRLMNKAKKLMTNANNLNKVYKVYRHVRIWIYCQWAYAGVFSHEEHDALVREISSMRDEALKKFR